MKRGMTALLLVVILLVGVPRTAYAAIAVTLAQLNAGQLLLEGSGAVPNHAITADGTARGAWQ